MDASPNDANNVVYNDASNDVLVIELTIERPWAGYNAIVPFRSVMATT